MLYIVVTATDCCGAAIGVVDASCAVAIKAVITAVFAVGDILVLGMLTSRRKSGSLVILGGLEVRSCSCE